MPSSKVTDLRTRVEEASRQAGLTIVSADQSTTSGGQATALFRLGNAAGAFPDHTIQLELSAALELDQPEPLAKLAEYLRHQAQRLRNPNPSVFVTSGGIPIQYEDFHWPFHRSGSGADTYIVHGSVSLADGSPSPLRALVSASLTVTFAEILPAPEQPYAESFIYNAIRKMLDQGQIEMLKSGNRQPVPVTTRYYSRWQNKFLFSESTPETRQQFLLSKVFWLSGVLGRSLPVWIADPCDAQYLNTTPEELLQAAALLGQAGLLQAGAEGFAAAAPALLAREAEFRGKLEQSLAFTKPVFNEEMRAGHTNM